MEKIKDIPKEKFAYINEIGIQTQMYRQYARSKREKRVNIRISSKRYSQIGLVAAHCESEFVFPYIYDETMRASVFENWFEDELLHGLAKGGVIIMDNASFYKKEVLQNLAEK